MSSSNVSNINERLLMVKEALSWKGGLIGAAAGAYSNFDSENPFSSAAKGALAGGAIGAGIGGKASKKIIKDSITGAAGWVGATTAYKGLTGKDVSLKGTLKDFHKNTQDFLALGGVLAGGGKALGALGKGVGKAVSSGSKALKRARGIKVPIKGGLVRTTAAKMGPRPMMGPSAGPMATSKPMKQGLYGKAKDFVGKHKWTAAGAVAGGAKNYDPENPYSSVAKGALVGGLGAKALQSKLWDKPILEGLSGKVSQNTTNKALKSISSRVSAFAKSKGYRGVAGDLKSSFKGGLAMAPFFT